MEPARASPAPSRQAEPSTPAREAEPRLESGWFRDNVKFRSPMLQLHKGIILLSFRSNGRSSE